jgi:hypothetical protein
MSKIDRYAPGEFCWNDLQTTDPASAKAFYGALFGWSFEDLPFGDGQRFSMAKLSSVSEGRVAALVPMNAVMRAANVPPHWESYVAVASADAIDAKVSELGGQRIAPPFDVMDAGRMCAFDDPSGAGLCAWEARELAGSAFRDEPGAVCWLELNTRDVPGAKAFLTSLFGWTAHDGDETGMPYTEFQLGGRSIAGMMAMPAQVPAHVPSFWLVYFAVADCDATVKQAIELGGQLTVPPIELGGIGRFARLRDAQGAVFGVLGPTKK